MNDAIALSFASQDFFNVAVMSGSADIPTRYDDDMAALGQGVAELPNTRWVWGGGDKGLMGVGSRAFKAHSSIKPLGLLPGFLKNKETPAPDDKAELYMVDTFDERMNGFWLSDAVVFVPGGHGTLQEDGDVTAKILFGLCNPFLIMLNLYGFFDHHLAQIERAKKDGFINEFHARAEPKVTTSVDHTLAVLRQTLDVKAALRPGG